MLLTDYGTEWRILCWCAVKKLLTHSRRHILYTIRTRVCNHWLLNHVAI